MNAATKSTFLATHDHDGIALDIYGQRDEDGVFITEIKLRGDKRDISELFTSKTTESIAECVDAKLSREARQQNAEARAERHVWGREFSIA